MRIIKFILLINSLIITFSVNSQIFPSFPKPPNTPILNDILNRLKSNDNQEKAKDSNANSDNYTIQNIDKLLPKELLSFTKKYDPQLDRVNNILNEVYSKEVKCENRKFKYKEMCLGSDIRSFSQVYAVFASGASLANEFRINRVRLQTANILPSTRTAECSALSPSFIDNIDRNTDIVLSLPNQFSRFTCRAKNESLLGRGVEVYFEFLNGKLIQISIEAFRSDVTDLVNTYQQWFDDKNLEIDDIYLASNVNTAVFDARKKLEFNKRWINKKDNTEFLIGFYKEPGNRDRNIIIYSPEILKTLSIIEVELSLYSQMQNQKKISKDF
jgi:hypothetical protein